MVASTASQVARCHSSLILIFSSEEQDWADRDQVLFTHMFLLCVLKQSRDLPVPSG